MPQRFRLLNEEQVRALLPMSDLIASMESSLGRFSAGEVLQPVRTVLTVGPTRAYFGLMPAFIPQPASLGAKLVTVFSNNAARQLPSHLATILLLDPETGALQAIIDGRYITEARTAAVSAVSVRHLARTNASRLAIVGTGVQAQSHLDALPHVRSLQEIRVWSPNPASRDRFARDMRGHSAPAIRRMTQSAEEAVRGADIVVLVTSSPTPVIDDSWVSDGAHVVSVGACRPDQREMAPPLVARSRLFVDSKAAALVESGDVVQGIAEGRFDKDHVRGELGELVMGRVRGRTTDAEVTIFKSLGMAVEDVVAADLAFRRAVEQGVGTELTL